MYSLFLFLAIVAVAVASAGGLYSVPAGAMIDARRPAGRAWGVVLRKGDDAGTSTIDFGDEAMGVFGLRVGRSTI